MILLQPNEIDFAQQLEESKKETPRPPPPVRQPKFFDNLIGATASAPFEAVSDIASLVSPTEYKPDPYKQHMFTVDPEQTGVAGKIAHGLLHGVSAFVIGAGTGFLAGGAVGAIAGGAITVATASGRRAFETARDEGVDPDTATVLGFKSGALMGVGALVPAGFGTNVVRSMLGGAAVNLGFSGLDQIGSYQIWKQNGYDEQAEHAAELDKISIATDILLGASFGAYHAKQLKKTRPPTPSEVDTAIPSTKASRKAAISFLL